MARICSFADYPGVHFVEPGYILEKKAHTIDFTRTPSHARRLEVKDCIIWQHLRRLKQHILRLGLARFSIREPYGGLSHGGGEEALGVSGGTGAV